MPYLLDTQAMLWALEDSPRLSQKARMIMEDETNILWISIASLWEIAIKVNIGKLELAEPLREILHKLPEVGILVLAIDPHHILEVETLELIHRDPFDRIIIAQGIAEGFEIISSDDIFKAYPVRLHW